MMRLRPLFPVASTLLLATALSGCHHRTVAAAPFPPLPAQTPVPIEKPKDEKPQVVAKVPLQAAPLPEVTVKEKPARRQRRKNATAAAKITPPVTPAPTLMASAAPPPTLGALTAGGTETTGKTEQAKSMITELERRLKNLEANVREQQRQGIQRVRYFEHEASQALKMGDADGAVTLVTKAKLLLDDLVK